VLIFIHYFPPNFHCNTTQSNPDIAPPSISAHESLGAEILCQAIFRFTANLHIPPATAMNQKWRYIGTCVSLFFPSFLLSLRSPTRCVSVR